MSISALIEQLKSLPNCQVTPPTGLPQSELTLPVDLQEFYRLTGGVRLFADADYAIDIVSPPQFARANPVIVGEDGEDDISFDWFIVAQAGEQYITIDLNPARLGRCYDSFWDRHGLQGETAIIALSFEELLQRLIQGHGDDWYWLQDHFSSLGDAYDTE